MFYYRLKDFIRNYGKSYREIARVAGVDLSTLVRLAQAKTTQDYNLSLRTLDALCDYFRCKPEELVVYKKK